MITALLLLCLACAPRAAEPPAPVVEPPPAPVVEPPPAPVVEPPAAPVATGLITDEQCEAMGGVVITQDTYAHLDRRRRDDEPRQPFRICHVPSPRNGAACQGDADCEGGKCYCAGALSRPDPQRDPALRALDGAPATGRCSDEPIPSGSWYCLVVDGKANFNGIIVD